MIITKTQIRKLVNKRSLLEKTTKVAVAIDSWKVNATTGNLELFLSNYEVVGEADKLIERSSFVISKETHEDGLLLLPASPTFQQFVDLFYTLLIEDYNSAPIYDLNSLTNNWELR